MEWAILFLALLPFFVASAVFSEEQVKTLEKPGIVLTFDDYFNIENWVKQIPLFEKYNTHATFFINAANRLSDNQKKGLQTLIEAGHEIGSHGFNHLKVVEYINKNGLDVYLRKEIEPANKALLDCGVTPVAFAYPNSNNDETSDKALQRYYRHCRSGASIPEGKTLAELDRFFIPLADVAGRFCFTGKGCDRADDDFLKTQIFPALKRAKERNEILVLYAHNIEEESNSHFIKPEMLEKILKKAVELDLAFYRYRDLPSNFDSADSSRQSNISIEQNIIFEGYDRKTCWVHARVGLLPDNKAVLTTQKLRLTGSDIFYAIHHSESADNGKTWSLLQKQSTLDRQPVGDGVEICPCDGTPTLHRQSGKLLLTGHTAFYKNDSIFRFKDGEIPLNNEKDRVQSKTYYSVYDSDKGNWGELKYLLFPKESPFRHSGAGCTQRYDLPDGSILLPVYGLDPNYSNCSQVAVIRCSFDGTTLKYLEEGTALTLNIPRGFGEPSIIGFGGKFYLTLRNDQKGYVAVSGDGLNYSQPVCWCWDDGQEIGNYNTQQHWITGGGKLYLVYTRRAGNNDHVFRHRAPLFIAEVNPEKLTLIREMERIVVPERGARLGNFGIVHVSDKESWVVVSEWMQSPRGGGEKGYTDCESHGSNNAIWLSRIVWGTISVR